MSEAVLRLRYDGGELIVLVVPIVLILAAVLIAASKELETALWVLVATVMIFGFSCIFAARRYHKVEVEHRLEHNGFVVRSLDLLNGDYLETVAGRCEIRVRLSDEGDHPVLYRRGRDVGVTPRILRRVADVIPGCGR